MPQTRRSLLASLLATLAAPSALRAQTGRKVSVVGAGLVGLSAARDLVVAAAEVLLLEARARIGGRIWASRHWPDLPMDMGASRSRGARGNPLTALADAAGAARLATSHDSAIELDRGGARS